MVTLLEARAILDGLRDAGLSTDEIARRLKLHQVHQNARGLRHIYAGRTNLREVERRALLHLLNEVNNQ